jgi:hypothetical protein
MRWLTPLVVAAALLLGPAAGLASAVSVEDLLALRAKGLSDDILVALIQSDGSSFQLDAEQVGALHDAGLSDRVLIAMLNTRKPEPAPAAFAAGPVRDVAPMPADEMPVVEEIPAAEIIEPATVPVEPMVPVMVPVAVPVAVPVVVSSSHERGDEVRGHAQDGRNRGRSSQPVYWGYGGTLRPDAWQPARSSSHDRSGSQDRSTHQGGAGSQTRSGSGDRSGSHDRSSAHDRSGR